MSPFRVALVLVALLSFGATDAAAEHCFEDTTSGALYHFPRLKIPKKVGDVSPAHGEVLGSPLTGTLVRGNPGTLVLAFLFHGNHCNVVAALDADTLSGSVSLDCGLDGSFEANHPLNLVSCDADM